MRHGGEAKETYRGETAFAVRSTCTVGIATLDLSSSRTRPSPTRLRRIFGVRRYCRR